MSTMMVMGLIWTIIGLGLFTIMLNFTYAKVGICIYVYVNICMCMNRINIHAYTYIYVNYDGYGVNMECCWSGFVYNYVEFYICKGGNICVFMYLFMNRINIYTCTYIYL
jgi:hypothetical protein